MKFNVFITLVFLRHENDIAVLEQLLSSIQCELQKGVQNGGMVDFYARKKPTGHRTLAYSFYQRWLAFFSVE